MSSPKQVIGNLDRTNIYEKIFREEQDAVAYEGILRPVAELLLKLGIDFPITIIYLTLPWCGRAYKLLRKTSIIHPGVHMFQKTDCLLSFTLPKLIK